MKRTIQILIIIFILTSICYSQTVIEKNKLKRYIGSAGHTYIYDNTKLSIDNLDIDKVTEYATKLFTQLGLDIDPPLSKQSFCMMGWEKGRAIIIYYTKPILNISISHSTPKGEKLPTAEEETKIRNYQISLTEQMIKELQLL
jgi:hypothetical protein